MAKGPREVRVLSPAVQHSVTFGGFLVAVPCNMAGACTLPPTQFGTFIWLDYYGKQKSPASTKWRRRGRSASHTASKRGDLCQDLGAVPEPSRMRQTGPHPGQEPPYSKVDLHLLKSLGEKKHVQYRFPLKPSWEI